MASPTPDDIGYWKPSRKYPDLYPGECPSGDYLLLNDRVVPFDEDHDGTGVRRIDELLASRGLPLLAERTPVFAYGGNRNPGTLDVKLSNYGYRSPNSVDRAIPVLRAWLGDAEVVASGLHGHGYLFGELLLKDEFSTGTVLEARVCMVDPEQLRVLNESEGIRGDGYHVARIDEVCLPASGAVFSALGYVSTVRTWVSPALGGPISFTSVPARHRRLTAMSSMQALGHVIDVLDLRKEIRSLTALRDDATLPGELAKYLNGQWWYRFHTGRRPIDGYRAVLSLFAEAMADSAVATRTLDRLEAAGALIPVEEAFDPVLVAARLGRSPFADSADR